MDTTCCMTGRLGTPVELRTAKNGAPYARFRLASTPRIQRNGEWSDGETTWVSVRCYRTLAANAEASLRKGDPILVVGKLRTECWTDEQGTPREFMVLDAAAIGHDLSLGISHFRKPERRAERASDDGAGEPGTGVESSAANAEQASDCAESGSSRGSQPPGDHRIGKSTKVRIIGV